MSTGLGLRIAALGGLQAALDWAYPLRNSGDTLSGDHRLHFRLRYEF
jgi:hemolysin activation/secretion protein